MYNVEKMCYITNTEFISFPEFMKGDIQHSFPEFMKGDTKFDHVHHLKCVKEYMFIEHQQNFKLFNSAPKITCSVKTLF